MMTYVPNDQTISKTALDSPVSPQVNSSELSPLVNMIEVSVIEDTAGSGKAVRFTRDGTPPSNTVGHRIKAGVYTFRGDVLNLKFKNEETSGCSLYISFFIDG